MSPTTTPVATTEIAGLGAIGVGALNEATQPEPVEPGSPDNVAALIYTSGTTGNPKGVMLTHRNVLFMADGAARIRSIVPQDRVFGVLPMCDHEIEGDEGHEETAQAPPNALAESEPDDHHPTDEVNDETNQSEGCTHDGLLELIWI